jgi:hypothetical protein
MVDAPSATPGVFALAPASPGAIILDSKPAVIPDPKSNTTIITAPQSVIDGDF